MLRPIHDRMPAILAADHFDVWLDTKAPLAQAKARLRPYPGAMTIYPVSDWVNAVRNDGLRPTGLAVMSCDAAGVSISNTAG
jgi:putative SOS response-associated peptidase YedK